MGPVSAVESHVPPDDRVWAWVVAANALGPRLPGNAADAAFAELLVREFEAAGLDVARDRFAATHRAAPRARLVLGGPDAAEVEIASVYAESGATPADGITAPMVYLGDVRSADPAAHDVRDRVAVVDCAMEDVPLAYTRTWGVVGGDGREPPSSARLATRLWGALEAVRAGLADRGARAVVVAWTNLAEADALGQYQPLRVPANLRETMGGGGEGGSVEGGGLPTVWVGRAARGKLLDAMAGGADVTVTVESDVVDGVAETVVATLAGASDETIVVVSHSDGVNAVQENGPVALVALAHAFARLPITSRRRTLAFAAVTGHFARELRDLETGRPAHAESEGLLARHPHLASRTVAAIAVEHLGATEWVDDGVAYAPTGRSEWGHAITASEGLAGALLASFDERGAGPVVAVEGRPWGIAHPFEALGIPTVSYGTLPPYLLAGGAGGHLDKLSPARIGREIGAVARLLARLDVVDRLA